MAEQVTSGMEKALKEYLLSRHQPEWLEARGFGRLSFREFLALPEVRSEPGLVKVLLGPVIDAADRSETERDRMKAEQMQRDGMTWAGQYNEGRPPEKASYEGFKIDSRHPDLAEALAKVQEWGRETGPQILTLSAGPGRGKSHLSKAAWHSLNDRGRHPVWAPEGQLIRDLHAAIGAKNLEGMVESLAMVPWLIIDDLGRGAWNPFIEGVFDDIINSRWDTEGLRTLISTNLKGDALPPRMESRLKDVKRGLVFVIDAPDHRQLK